MTNLNRTATLPGVGLNDLLYGGNCPVPKTVAVCPECGGNLHVESGEWVEETGVPTSGGLHVDCEHEETERHRYWQSDWQSIIDAVEKWCGAEAV
jgi:hypothetical protein